MTAEKQKKIQINPLEITESLGYTTFRRYSRKPWTKEEDQKLNNLVNEKLINLGYKDGINSLFKNSWLINSIHIPQDIDWEDIGMKLETRKPKDCRKRWANSLDPTLKKGKWTNEEDENLIKSFQKNGASWQKISLEIPGRTDDQCAKRYIEVLDPNTKDRLRTWSLEEDLSLIKKVKNYGTKWRTISLEMQSRPSLTCRNRWRKIVTDVVRGKACEEIKTELDTIQGGLSKLEEISENLQTLQQRKHDERQKLLEKNKKISKIDESKEIVKSGSKLKKIENSSINSKPTPSYPITEESNQQIPSQTEIDWKYTLKDTSGLSLSSGSINTTELAKQLIEQAKKYDLKISIHQHIHHHYSSSFGQLGSKDTSPADSTPSNHNSYNSSHNISGQEEVLPNRYSHFNYLPPMAQPQLGSSSIQRNSDLNKLLNPQTYKDSNSIQNHKRKLSHSSNNSSSPNKELPEDLEEELDFWETMRSLSQVVNSNPTSRTTTSATKTNNKRIKPAQNINHTGSTNGTNNTTPTTLNNNDYELFYNTFGNGSNDVLEERFNEDNDNVDDDDDHDNDDDNDDEDNDDLEEELKGLAGLLPFNPS
ncbi:hypothetical protein WICMUC_002847 [Wickerhamomyces mucosus]|uniref:Uncharacterized protein n=1 Tax=Wickerhamomyces mucosus TaxID=1378264 RepID=A0A9P8PP23_9ASCO|nr:hypothetical protein WICMUC_002847 [Wickerhamomyces mucosus]